MQYTTLAESVMLQIQQMIERGDFKVGEKLPAEQTMCRQLNISRPTLREAYRALHEQGVIELKNGRGAFVKLSDDTERSLRLTEWFTEHKAELMDCFDIREALEPLAVRLAIERAKPNELYEITGINALFKKAVSEGDSSKMSTYDELFHIGIVKASHNQLLSVINSHIVSSMEPYRNNSFAVNSNGVHAVQPHDEIVDAILRKDVEKAQSAMLEHLRISRLDIESVISKTINEEQNHDIPQKEEES